MLLTTFDSLVRVEIQLWNALEARLLKEERSTLGRFLALRVIDRRTADHGTCRVIDIADALVVTVGGVSKLVDRLEQDGLCTRAANPEDRRSSLLELTQSGHQLLERASAALEEELSALLGHLNGEDLANLASTLNRLDAR